MKTIFLKTARLALTWSLDLYKLADAQLFYWENGKTLEQHKNELMDQVMKSFYGDAPHSAAKDMFSRSNKKPQAN